jgi:hypothetical protein
MYIVTFVTFNRNKARTSEDALSYVGLNIDKCKEIHGYLGCKNGYYSVFDWFKFSRRGISFIFEKYKLTGSDDNAVILTRDLYDEVIKVFENYTIEKNTECNIKWNHVDLDNEKVSPDFIGKKWFVLVNIHAA